MTDICLARVCEREKKELLFERENKCSLRKAHWKVSQSEMVLLNEKAKIAHAPHSSTLD